MSHPDILDALIELRDRTDENFPYYGQPSSTLYKAAAHVLDDVDETSGLHDFHNRELYATLWNSFTPVQKLMFSFRVNNPRCGEPGCFHCLVWNDAKRVLEDPK